MGSLLDQLQKKSRVIIHISNPQIQQHPYAKMASFKILLVVALVAFIGSSDALKCLTKKGAAAAATAECAEKKSCLITATIKLKPAATTITKQECVANELAKKKFVVPEEIKDGAEVSFHCKDPDCNTEQAIKGVLREDATKTKEAMEAAGATVETKAAKATAGLDGKTDEKTAGAAQTTVAVATIAFSMIMARLALLKSL